MIIFTANIKGSHYCYERLRKKEQKCQKEIMTKRYTACIKPFVPEFEKNRASVSDLTLSRGETIGGTARTTGDSESLVTN